MKSPSKSEEVTDPDERARTMIAATEVARIVSGWLLVAAVLGLIALVW